MATASTGTDVTSTPKDRTAITACVLVGMMVMIIYLACWTRSKRPQDLPEPATVSYSRTVRQQPRQRVSKSIVNSIPVVEYGIVVRIMKLNKEKDEEANLSLRTNLEAADKTTSSIHSSPQKCVEFPLTVGFLDVCPICIEAFSSTDEVRVTPCGHIFHHRCIDPWFLGVAGTCPTWYAFLELQK